MNKVLLFITLMAVWAFPAWSQMEISLGGGLMEPLGDTADEHVGDYLAGGTASYYLSSRFAVGGEIFYHKSGLTEADKLSLEEVGRTNGEKSIIDLAVSAKFFLNSGPIALYAKGLFGSYEYKEKWTEEDGAYFINSDKLPGVGVGLGIQIQSEGFFGGFIECIYNKIDLDDDYTSGSWEFVDYRAGLILKGY